MAHAVRLVAGAGERRWRPDATVVLIAKVDGLAGRIGHRVVRPRRQSVGLAVPLPGVAGAALGDEEPEVRVGHDVDPGRRRGRAARQVDDVLAAVHAEAAAAVEVLALTRLQRLAAGL